MISQAAIAKDKADVIADIKQKIADPVDGVRPALKIAAPMVETSIKLKDLPLIFPFLFITIACGAVSGFHCLVSSGTSSKQLRCETDACFVGYGSMLTEGFLAVLVILACVAGLGLGVADGSGGTLLGADAWNARYEGWATMSGLGAKVGAFVDGAANFLKALGISAVFATALMHHLLSRNSLIIPEASASSSSDTICPIISELTDTRTTVTYYPYRDSPVSTEDNWRTAGIGMITEPWTGHTISR